MVADPETLLDAKLQYLEALADLKRTEKFNLFKPYEPQIEFYALGAEKRERLFMAGNQTGKTVGGAYEATCHLTGLYPDWWKGKRFSHPVKAWAGGEGSELTRNKVQSELCGSWADPSAFGTGFIPGKLIISRALAHGISGALDNVSIKHVSGGTSFLGFKSYDQGREKWQSETLDFVWEDEEPPADIHEEALARLTGKGILFVTCTPLKGETPFIRRFTRPTPEEARDRGVSRMGLKHVTHFTDEEKEKRLFGYPAHQRAARANGDPVIERGQIFNTPEADLKVTFPDEAMQLVSASWAKLWGLDFGFTHPFAAALCAIDPKTDTFYVLRVIRMRDAIPVMHAAAMKLVAPHIPVAWPHDGTHTEKGTGDKLADIYGKPPCSLAMLPEHATHAKVGGFQVWPGIMEMDVAMRSGKFKVLDTCWEFFEEYRNYRVEEDGKIYKVDDDLIDAVRCAWMMRRKAKPVEFNFDASAARKVRPTGRATTNPWTGRRTA